MTDYGAILRALHEHGVDFIVVGGVGAVLQGVPISTFDVDVVHSTEPANVQRLLAALERLDAHYRAQPERRLRPNASHLTSSGHQLLTTAFGPLDLLGSVGKQRTYRDLLPDTEELDIGGVAIRVLSLASLITTKEETGGEKDLHALPLLRRTLEEKLRLKKES